MSRPLLSPPAVVILISAGVFMLALSVALPDRPPGAAAAGGDRAGANTYSVSALGQAGFYDLLKRLGRPVGRGLEDSVAQAGPEGVVILAEPDLGRLWTTPEGRRLLEAPRLLLALPKRGGRTESARRGWISQAWLLPQAQADLLLRWADKSGATLRAPWPETWTINELGPAPTPADSEGVQLMRPGRLRPVVACPEGILVGEMRIGERTVWVLADPDPLANHGLVKGGNAAFMLALVDRLRRNQGAPLVFDETAHGFRRLDGSLLGLMFKFPFVLVVLLAAFAAALAAWAGSARFGALRRPRPVLDFGKAGLIANGARLLNYAGRQKEILRLHARLTLRSAALALGAPQGMDEMSLAAWLDRHGRLKDPRLSLSGQALWRQTLAAGEGGADENLARLLTAVRQLHFWKEELLNGSDPRRFHRQRHPV